MIAIIDLGLGNIGSVVNMFRRVGSTTVVTDDTTVVASAAALVLVKSGIAGSWGLEPLQALSAQACCSPRAFCNA